MTRATARPPAGAAADPADAAPTGVATGRPFAAGGRTAARGGTATTGRRAEEVVGAGVVAAGVDGVVAGAVPFAEVVVTASASDVVVVVPVVPLVPVASVEGAAIAAAASAALIDGIGSDPLGLVRVIP